MTLLKFYGADDDSRLAFGDMRQKIPSINHVAFLVMSAALISPLFVRAKSSDLMTLLSRKGIICVTTNIGKSTNLGLGPGLLGTVLWLHGTVIDRAFVIQLIWNDFQSNRLGLVMVLLYGEGGKPAGGFVFSFLAFSTAFHFRSFSI